MVFKREKKLGWEELMSFGKIKKSLDFMEICGHKLTKVSGCLARGVYEFFNPSSFFIQFQL